MISLGARFRKDAVGNVKSTKLAVKSFDGIDVREGRTKDAGICDFGYNIKLGNGVLTNSYGVKTPSITLSDGTTMSIQQSILDKNIVKITLFPRFNPITGEPDDYLVALTGDGNVYVTDVATPSFWQLPLAHFTSLNVTFMNYHFGTRDTILMASDVAGEFYLYNVSNVQDVPSAPALKSPCIHQDRVYGISTTGASTIKYSAELDPTNWQEGQGLAGSISLLDEGGAIRKILSFGGYLFIFRDRALQRLHISTASPIEYSVSKVFSGTDVIVPGSVTMAGDGILFLAGKRLYTTDGFNVKSFGENLTEIIANPVGSVGECLDGTYYLATSVRKYATEAIGDEATQATMINNGVLSFNLENGGVGILRGVDISGMAPIVTGRTQTMFVTFNGTRSTTIAELDNSGKLYDSPLPSFWVKDFSDLGSLDAIKVTKYARAFSQNPLTMTVYSGGESKSATFDGGNAPRGKKLVGRGSTIKVSLAGSTGLMRVSSINLDVDYIGRYYGD